MTDKEKIRAELERRMYDDYNSGEAEVDCVAQGVCASMIQFIDSLQEEPVSEDFEEEIQRHLKECLNVKFPTTDIESVKKDIEYTARHFANWQKKKTLKESEDAIQYVKENHSPSEVSDFQNAMNIAVMKAFDAGKEKMREQMMKDAVEVNVKIDAGGYPYIPAIELYDYDNEVFLTEAGDKVKVKIVKKD